MKKRGRPPKSKIEVLVEAIPKKMGRHEREFDSKIFEGLCGIHCTAQEITSVLKTDMRTLNKWCERFYKQSFSEVYQTYTDHGKMSLRRYQFDIAKRNSSMSIWLGKQYLGQKDDRILVPVTQENWPFFDTSKNPLNIKTNDQTNDHSSNGDPSQQQILADEPPILHQGQERPKSDL